LKLVAISYCPGSKCSNLLEKDCAISISPSSVVFKLYYCIFWCFVVWALVSAALVSFGVVLLVYECHTVV